MKHLFTLLLTAITFTGFAQISPPDVPKSGTKQATTMQGFIYKSLTGDTIRYYLRLGATGIPADYYEISKGGGGGSSIDTNRLMYLDKSQTSTGYKSFAGRAAVSNTAASGSVALDITSIGTGTGLIVTNAGGSNAAQFITTTGYAVEGQNVSSSVAAIRGYNIGTGDHARFGNTSGKIATFVNSGNLITPKASASNHVVVKSQLDSVGALISGGVTSVSAGYGTNFSTITSTGSVVVDTTVIASRDYVDKRVSYVLKDFYADSVVANNTSTPIILYADTLKANQFVNNGDKLIVKMYGIMNITTVADQYLFFNYGGSDILTFTLTPSAIGTISWEVEVVLFKKDSGTLNMSGHMVMSGSPSPTKVMSAIISGSPFSTSKQVALRASQSSNPIGSITAKNGYIEFKPAAL